MYVVKPNDAPAYCTTSHVVPSDFEGDTDCDTWDQVIDSARLDCLRYSNDRRKVYDLRLAFPPPMVELWTADEIAECLEISRELRIKLWGLKAECESPTPLGGEEFETPDCTLSRSNDDKPMHWWGKLSKRERLEIWGGQSEMEATFVK